MPTIKRDSEEFRVLQKVLDKSGVLTKEEIKIKNALIRKKILTKSGKPAKDLVVER